MVEIKTYIKKKEIINSLENINEKKSQYFVSFDNEECLNYIEDFDYIEGAIVICSEGEYILDFRCWDLVDQLWVYLIDAIYEMLNEKRETKFYFPDQPLEFKMKEISEYTILLSIKEKKYVVNKMDFLISLLDSAEKFFLILSKCNAEKLVSQSKTELIMVKAIKEKLLNC